MTEKIINYIKLPDGETYKVGSDDGTAWGTITGDITSQTDLQTALDSKQPVGNYALKSEIPTNNNQLTNGAGYITADYHDSTKQDTLVSATNIKTINGESVLGSGDIEIKGGGLEVCDIGMALYVDETKGLRRYLNGQIVDINTNTQAFLNRLKEIVALHPSLATTEEEWQTAKTMSAFGQVGKFVFNYSGDEIVSVRLPRVVNVQGLFDLQNLGMTVSAGLPNITGGGALRLDNYGLFNNNSGVFKRGSDNRPPLAATTGAGFSNELYFDASRSSSIYGNSNTVQPESIQYPYFIQIATGSETEANIINTLENVNGFTLLESKYSDKPLYNESWLLSNGQWNAKAVYPTVYEALQVEYNTEIEAGTTVTLPSGVSYTKRGLSVKLSTDSDITDYDFRLNTADETFRLPLLNGSENIVDYSKPYSISSLPFTATVNGQLQAMATTAGANNASVNGQVIFKASIASAYGQTTNQKAMLLKGDTAILESGGYDEIVFYPYKGNGSLYFYVGDLDQNHGIVNMGRFGEQLATKTDMLQASGAGMPSGRYIDLTLGASGTTYTAPANGYLCLAKQTTDYNQYVQFNATGAGLQSKNMFLVGGDVYNNGTLACCHMPMKKGQSTKIYYNAGGTVYVFRFIYAEGEV